jgi:hypothetical protein
MYDEAVEKLIEAVPELGAKYRTELDWWGGEKPGPHIVYGNVLNPYVDTLLESGREHELRRVFEFLERLSTNGDAHVREIVAVTVCEYLGADERRLNAARKYMGPETVRISNEVEKFWGTS